MKILRSACNACDFAGLERRPRSLWMRLLPSMRHYWCSQCDRTLLAPKALVDSKRWMMTSFRDFPGASAPAAPRHSR